MNYKTTKLIFLADKSKLAIGDTVISNAGITVITEIKNGGCIGEYIASEKYWLSDATLYTYDLSKSLPGTQPIRK